MPTWIELKNGKPTENFENASNDEKLPNGFFATVTSLRNEENTPELTKRGNRRADEMQTRYTTDVVIAFVIPRPREPDRRIRLAGGK